MCVCVCNPQSGKYQVRLVLKGFLTSGLPKDFIRLTWISSKDIEYGLFPNLVEFFFFPQNIFGGWCCISQKKIRKCWYNSSVSPSINASRFWYKRLCWILRNHHDLHPETTFSSIIFRRGHVHIMLPMEIHGLWLHIRLTLALLGYGNLNIT